MREKDNFPYFSTKKCGKAAHQWSRAVTSGLRDARAHGSPFSAREHNIYAQTGCFPTNMGFFPFRFSPPRHAERER